MALFRIGPGWSDHYHNTHVNRGTSYSLWAILSGPEIIAEWYLLCLSAIAWYILKQVWVQVTANNISVQYVYNKSWKWYQKRQFFVVLHTEFETCRLHSPVQFLQSVMYRYLIYLPVHLIANVQQFVHLNIPSQQKKQNKFLTGSSNCWFTLL